MTVFQYSVVGALALSAALSVLFFDKRGRKHKPLAAFVAYITFVQMAALAAAAYMRHQVLVEWLMISGLSVYVGGILLARGNVTRIFTVEDK